MSRNECAKMFSHLCVEDSKYTLGLIMLIFLNLDGNDYDRVKYFEKIFDEILRIKDNYTEARISKFLELSL